MYNRINDLPLSYSNLMANLITLITYITYNGDINYDY